MYSRTSHILLSTVALFSLSSASFVSAASSSPTKKAHFAVTPSLLTQAPSSAASTLPTDPSDTTTPLPQVVTSGPEATTPASPLPPMVIAGSNFDPLTILLKPTLELSPLPPWALSPAKIDSNNSCVEIKLPPLSEQSEIENYTLTVTFQDPGDGGPLVEWMKPNGEKTMLCSGLGVNGPAVGLNSGTLLIPYDLVFDGGTLVVSYAGRFDRIYSLAVRPGHSATVSALGEKNTPAIIDESSHVISKELASGEAPLIKKGDTAHHHLISAELSAPVQNVRGEVEFVIPLRGLPQATMLHTEFIGLDVDSQVAVEANGVSIGTLNTQDFQLDTPELIIDNNTSKIQFAGWRQGWLYISSAHWKEGDNSLVFKIIPGTNSNTPTSLFLRNTRLDLRYSKTITNTYTISTK